MSATAFAHHLAPQATVKFVQLVQQLGHLATNGSKATQAVYRELLGNNGAALASAVRDAGTAKLTLEAFVDELGRAVLSQPVAPKGAGFSEATGTWFVQFGEWQVLSGGEGAEQIETAIQKILHAALTTDRVLNADVVLGLLANRGRPKTHPEVVLRARKLRDRALTYKEIARRLNAAHREEGWAEKFKVENEFTVESVRAMLTPRPKAKKKRA